VHGPLLPLALHVHHHFHGSRVDYIGIGLAAAASWIGLTGPGEAALIAGGIAAAHGHVDLLEVVAIAWLGAMAGGLAGWLVGLRAGRVVMTAPGPLHRLRLRLLASGDRFFARYGPLAVLFTPSWVAGINGMRATRFVPFNALAALVWALAFGLGAYLVGPSIADVAGDAGLVGLAVLAGVVAAVSAARLLLRRRRRGRGPNMHRGGP
jgi:membrane protein DedA with SNARE-associated domain